MTNVVRFPKPRPPEDRAIGILIDVDDRGLYADVDGFEIRSGGNLELLMQLVKNRVKQVWGSRPTT